MISAHTTIGTADEESSSTLQDGGVDGFLESIHHRLERRNLRMVEKIRAWAELLDALAWCVAHEFEMGGTIWMGRHAREWVDKNAFSRTANPESLEVLRQGIPADLIRISLPGILLWSSGAASELPAQRIAGLSRREREVTEWLQKGKTSPEIAVILGISVRTVDKHLENLYRKLGVRDRDSVILIDIEETD